MNTFSLGNHDVETLIKKIAKIESGLQKSNWEKLVRVKEQNELANIYIKMEGSRVVGLTVMAVEKKNEAVFVNIVGDIDMDSIGKLGGKFNIPQLDSINATETTQN